ncbi:hypothetical protein A3C87_03465 [Candidatus Kaiserbacteria bacterium RIFCSPHIGHO2_02_FULL_49_34]|uniref:Endonuclease III n=1 Tax=Candidatus Kaiserbacteria bacterium RIFCSPHIGHO2_02_FULL_49_34 TaxID=1798491 RepID=A0A1F6DIG7_9BACT|nr:MAG: hypothetical protein A3C87_03465 [Candidatus Kaiserbacteria bacterium RIFCSPHIGHO2_02_FULL_49_34]
MDLLEERKTRAGKMVRVLKKLYPVVKSELDYETEFQFLVAVVLSAQCTDKRVNIVTKEIFKKYRTAKDFAETDPAVFAKEIGSIPFFNNKTKAIIGAAKIVAEKFGGRVPKTEKELVQLPGVGYKTAHVILGDLFQIWEGIPTDTHVKRFALKLNLTKNKDLKKISHDLEELIPKKDWKYVNNGLVLYGRYICKAHPHDCTEHPLTKLYPAAANIWPKTT